MAVTGKDIRATAIGYVKRRITRDPGENALRWHNRCAKLVTPSLLALARVNLGRKKASVDTVTQVC